MSYPSMTCEKCDSCGYTMFECTCEKDMVNDLLIEVCEKCYKASCWQGVFMCEEYKNAGTIFVTRETLIEMAYEHPDYWKE